MTNEFIKLHFLEILNILCNDKNETKLMYYLLENNINNETSENQNVICKNISVSIRTLNRIIKRLKNKNWIKIIIIFKNNKRFSNIKISHKFYKDFHKISNKLNQNFSNLITPKNTKTMEANNKKIGYTKNLNCQEELKQNIKVAFCPPESPTGMSFIGKKSGNHLQSDFFQMPKNQDVINMKPNEFIEFVTNLCNFYVNNNLMASEKFENATVSKRSKLVPVFQQDFLKEKESSKEKEKGRAQ